MTRIHGGADAQGVPRFDFSSNSNACGPCPLALQAIQQADPSVYPDPAYTALRTKLAVFHGVPVWRIVLAGGASEFIFRIAAWVAKQSALQAKVNVPTHSYADYAYAAKAWGLGIVESPVEADLVWACEPSSPLGNAHFTWPSGHLLSDQVVVLDCAYEPLRLSGQSSLSQGQRDTVWQLWTPNKALGFTGVRAAYAIAPQGTQEDALALEQLSASWPVGAHGVALLEAWTEVFVQDWIADSLQTLATWKARQLDWLQNLGWTCFPSDSNFFCASPPQSISSKIKLEDLLRQLREEGIKLRDATSFGLPNHVRMSVQPPPAQDALCSALSKILRTHQ
jgi:histidinol-phosphate aminotransferase